MMRKLLFVAAMSLTVAGCFEDEKPAAKLPETKAVSEKTQKEIDPEAYKNNIAGAMAEIPTSMRSDFQRLLVCQIKVNNESDAPKPIDAEYIRSLTAYLKANPAAADNC